ncbi:MAG: YfiT family bacillithiol transferase, partial [Gemmatimonadota bacterium]
MSPRDEAVEIERLRYPIGRFAPRTGSTRAERTAWIDQIEHAPAAVRDAVRGLDDARLDTPYRPGGWTVRQVVHHLPDSHVNAYVRMKLAVTEDTPTIRPYEEAAWAEQPDARRAPVELSLRLLEALHARWVHWLRALHDDDFTRPLHHPEA